MKRFITDKKRLTMIFLMVMLSVVFSIGQSLAEDEETTEQSFADLIGQMKTDGIIPDTEGTFLSLGRFEDSLANLGFFHGIPLFESEHFVISADIEWASGSDIPNYDRSGCGFIFNADAAVTDHLMVSLRMDGKLYVSGARYYKTLNYGNYFYGLSGNKGKGKLTLFLDGDHIMAWVNGSLIVDKRDLPVWGSAGGLAVISGTNQSFGTRCIFTDIHVFTWEQISK